MSAEQRMRAAHAEASARAQATAAERVRERTGVRAPDPSEVRRTDTCAGLVTRAIAYSVDLAAVNVAALGVAVAVALALSLVRGLPSSAEAIIAGVLGVAYVAWTAGYFVMFWSTTGQTPGARLMRIRVVDGDGGRIGAGRAVTRFVGLVLATIPLGAGFLIMLWDDRRRCLQDWLARTVVIHAAPQAQIVRHRVPRSSA
jgi:uncharacterized RDD family membrane protein YckC